VPPPPAEDREVVALRKLGHELFAEYDRGEPGEDYWFWW